MGFTADEIGCHSLRAAASMAMLLAGVSEIKIMILDRWKSLAFLDYIRKQVAEFSINISGRMMTAASFYTTPDYSTTTQTSQRYSWREN